MWRPLAELAWHEWLYAANAAWLVCVVQATLLPVSVKATPVLRRVLRVPDQLCRMLKLQLNFTLMTLMWQMSGGVLGSELGVHVALLNVAWARWGALDFAKPAVHVAFLAAATSSGVLLLTTLAGLYAFVEMRRAIGAVAARASVRSAEPSLVATLAFNLVAPVTPQLLLRLPTLNRFLYPGIRFDFGVSYNGQQHLDVVYAPAALRQRRNSLAPVLLYVHGGGWARGQRLDFPSLLCYAAATGCVVVTATYRLAPRHPFPAQIVDVNAALKWTATNAERYGGDSKCIVIMGGSAGGHLAALASTSNLDLHHYVADVRPRACVSFYGVYTFDDVDFQRYFGKVIMRQREADGWSEDMFNHASPLYWIDKRALHLRDMPFLLVHGQMDNLVPIAEVIKFHSKLVQRGCNATLVNLTLAHHAFDLVNGFRASAVNMYVTRWIWALLEGHH